MALENEKEILKLLWGGLMDCGEENAARRVKSLYGEPTHQIISTLSLLENDLTDTKPWKAVVLCKAVFQTKTPKEKFEEYILTLQGLLPKPQ